MRKEHTATGQSTAKEIIRGKQTRRVRGVTQRDINEDALHDDKYCCAVDGDPDCRGDPMDGGIGGPGEEEEADCWADGGG